MDTTLNIRSLGRCFADSNTWSLLLSLALLPTALFLTANVTTRYPSRLQYDQQSLHCQLYNNDGAPSMRACLAQWCTNEAHWQYAWCNMTDSLVPYDPHYNTVYLTESFPYDPMSAFTTWVAFGVMAGHTVAETLIGSLQAIDPLWKVDSSLVATTRYSVLLSILGSALWLVRFAALGLLLYASLQTGAAWGLYNVSPTCWTALSILIGVLLLLHIFQRVLSICKWRYMKKSPDPEPRMDQSLEGPVRRGLGLTRKVSGVRVADTALGLKEDRVLTAAKPVSPQDAAENAKTPITSLEFSWREIMLATRGLDPSMVLGQGGFGKVYRGVLPSGLTVAFKVLDGQCMSGREVETFRAELEVINRVHHRNLVQLLGHCSQVDKLVLALEFMENGSLADFLEGKRGELDWNKRVQIAIGAARGLSYLHNDCSPRVIHRDVKASNILLDANFVAKVSDFGLARLLGEDLAHTTTRVMGTIGYLAPDYAFSGRLTDKSDVYSFGVVLLELLTGRKPIDFEKSGVQQSLVEWAWKVKSSSQDVLKLMDPLLEGHFSDSQALKLWALAINCVDPQAQNRPSMDEVLGGVLECQKGILKTSRSLGALTPVEESDTESCAIEGAAEQHVYSSEMKDGSTTASRQSSLSKIFAQLMTVATETFSQQSEELLKRCSNDLEEGCSIQVGSTEVIQSVLLESECSQRPSGEENASISNPEYWSQQIRHLRQR